MIRFLLIAAFVPALVAFVRLRGAQYRAARVLVGVVFLVLVVLSILFPQLWQDFADLVGVGRGVDLLLYLTIVAFITFAIAAVRKIRDLDQKIATIVMELAIDPSRVERGTESNNGHS